MKKLIVHLGEGQERKAYKITTFSMLQRNAFNSVKNDKETMEVYNSLKGRQDFEGLTDEELSKLMVIEEKLSVNMIDAVAKSLAKEHPEFILKKSENEDSVKREEENGVEAQRVRDLVSSIVDHDELTRLYNFAITGRYVRAENVYDETTEEQV